MGLTHSNMWTTDARSGFTLIELVVILFIFGILAAVMLPRTNSDALLLAGQAEQVASDIRYLQSLAMTRGQRYQMLFTPAATPVVYEYRQTAGGAVVVAHPVTAFAPVKLNTNVTLALASLPSNLIAFDGQGIPYTDGLAATTLTTTATLTLSFGSQSRNITITRETGRVAVQ